MSNIPTDIKNIINSTVFAPWYTDEGNIIFRKGAEFGYSLAIERIEGLEKEVERLRKVAANAFHEFRMRGFPHNEPTWEQFKTENKL